MYALSASILFSKNPAGVKFWTGLPQIYEVSIEAVSLRIAVYYNPGLGKKEDKCNTVCNIYANRLSKIRT